MFWEIKVKFWQLWKKYVLRAFDNTRDNYYMGRVELGKVEDIETKLINIGFQPNYFSFGDAGQVSSMRRMYVDKDGYWRQQHIRVHEDGEIRGHDELSYEESAMEHVAGDSCREIGVEDHMKILLGIDGVYEDVATK